MSNYIENKHTMLNRKSNFIGNLASKRVARKAMAKLWIKISRFEEERYLQLLHSRVYFRKTKKLFKWSFKDDFKPRGTKCKIWYFADLYFKRK